MCGDVYGQINLVRERIMIPSIGHPDFVHVNNRITAQKLQLSYGDLSAYDEETVSFLLIVERAPKLRVR
jgi:hypothetical protein